MAGKLPSVAEKPESEVPAKEHTPLFFYLLLATGLAFWTRAMPTPFLPLVMAQDFHQTPGHVGVAMSVYPLGAFLATPFAAAQVQGSLKMMRLHSMALLFMSFSSLLMAFSPEVHDFAGQDATFEALLVFRFTQGVSQAFYMAANTALLSQRFKNVAYTVAMAEVAVGCGAQLGRLLGGFLFDLGGFACPFGVASLALCLCALIGFMFEEEEEEQELVLCAGEDAGEVNQDSCNSFLSARMFVPVAGVFSAYMMTGLMDATLPQHLEEHLGPLTVSAVSAISSLRSLTYLAVSWLCAQVLHGEMVSLETLLLTGVVCAVCGLLLAGPETFVADAEEMLPGSQPLHAWTCQLLSLVMAAAGTAMLFVPGLPLLQAEVRGTGPSSAAWVSSLLMAAMSGGEFFGPIVGGTLVEHHGFRFSCGCFAAAIFLALAPLTAVAQASRSRSTPLLERQVSFQEESQDLAKNMRIPMDESAYRFRRLPFVGPDLRQRLHSAPAQERRPFVPRLELALGSSTAPSASFRRAFLPRMDEVAKNGNPEDRRSRSHQTGRRGHEGRKDRR